MQKLIGFLCISLLGITGLLAQDIEPTAYYRLHYMTVKSADAAAHIEAETQYLSALHKQRIANGSVLSWDMWQVMNPLDMDGDEVTFLFVHTYPSLEKLMGEDNSIYNTFQFEGMSAKARQEMWDAHTSRLVSDWQLIVAGLGGFGNMDDQESVFASFNYMKVDERHGKDYVQMETGPFMEMHKENGEMLGWAIGKVLNYSGEEFPFNYITVDAFDSPVKLLESRMMIANIADFDANVREFFTYRTMSNSHLMALVARESGS